MIWPVYLGASLLLAAASRSPFALGLWLISFGLIAVSLAKFYFTAPVFWVFSGLIWIVIALMPLLFNDDMPPLPMLLLVVAGGLVFPARFIGAEYEIGQPLLVASDTCGIAAICLLGWPVISDWVARGGDMVSGHGFSEYRADRISRKDLP